jgi:hypothetical protein
VLSTQLEPCTPLACWAIEGEEGDHMLIEHSL